jgi:hypothetical protein
MTTDPAPWECSCDLLVVVDFSSFVCVSFYALRVFAWITVNTRLLSHMRSSLFFVRPRWPRVFVCLLDVFPIFAPYRDDPFLDGYKR